MAYATTADYVGYAGTQPPSVTTGLPRALQSASDLLDESAQLWQIYLDDDGEPLAEYADTLRDAVVRQVEYWITLGGGQLVEDSADILGLDGAVTEGDVTYTVRTGIAPRAQRALVLGGLWRGGGLELVSDRSRYVSRTRWDLGGGY